MIEKKEVIKNFSGFIINGENKVVFTSTNFLFRFMNNKTNKEYVNDKPIFLIPDNNGFIYGYTHGNKQIAINIGKEKVELRNIYLFKTTHYFIIENNDISFSDIKNFQYDSMLFYNGSLRYVMYPVLTDCTNIDKDGNPSKKYCDKHYGINDEEVSSIAIYSSKSEEISVEKGDFIITNSLMEIQLRDKKTFENFPKIYRRIECFLSFLLYSKNIAFDKIQLINHIDKYNEKKVLVYYDYDYNSNENLHGFNCIHFEQLNDNNIVNLYKNIIDESNQPVINFKLFKEIDEVPFYIDNAGAYELISCIEREYNFQKKELNEKEDKKLIELINSTKNFINEYKKNNSGVISEKTYNLIFGSINHWSMPVSLKLNLLINRYKEPLLNFMDSLDYNFINDEIIENDVSLLVKYRNGLIHREGKKKSDELNPKFCFIVLAVLYCSVLERSGCEKSKLKELLTHHFFNKYLQHKIY